MDDFRAGTLAAGTVDTGLSASSKLFKIVPSVDRRSCTIEPLTPSLGRRIVAHLTGLDLARLWKIIKDPTHLETKAGVYAFELVAQIRFGPGTKKIEVEHMGEDGLGDATTLECMITAVDTTTYNPLDLSEKVILSEKVAYWPTNSNFKGVDGFVGRDGMTSVVGFQVTTNAKGHPMPMSAFKAIRDKVHGKVDVGVGVDVATLAHIHVVFCVTMGVQEKYERKQVLRKNNNLSDTESAEVELHCANVSQYRYVLSEHDEPISEESKESRVW